MDINTIQILGVQIQEPIATVTDLLVSAVCFYAFYKIHKTGKKEKTFIYFKLYFIVMGIATIFGGLLGHAFFYAIKSGLSDATPIQLFGQIFYYKLGYIWKLPGWITSMFSIMFVERATIEHTKIAIKPNIIKVLRIINIVELLVFLILTIITLNFFFVEFHSGYGLMFVVLSLQLYLFYKTRNKASLTILIGIAVAAVAALIFMNKIDFHQWFNHISASHTLMAVAAVFFYKGVMKIDMKKLNK